MQILIRLGLFDGFAFCGKTFTRKSLCEITDIYNTLDLQTKKNFKILMDKIFDDEELTFEELFVEDKIVQIRIIRVNMGDKNLMNFASKIYGPIRIPENIRLEDWTGVHSWKNDKEYIINMNRGSKKFKKDFKKVFTKYF